MPDWKSIPVERLAAALLVCLFGVVCIFLGALQAVPSHAFPDRGERIRRAIWVGFAFQGSFLALWMIGALLNTKYQWSIESLGVLCLTLPLQILITVVTYSRFGLLSSTIQHITTNLRKQGESAKPSRGDKDTTN